MLLKHVPVMLMVSTADVAVYATRDPPPTTPQLSSSDTIGPAELCSVMMLSCVLKKHVSAVIVWPTHSVALQGCCGTRFEYGPHAYAELGGDCAGGGGLGGGGGDCVLPGGGGDAATGSGLGGGGDTDEMADKAMIVVPVHVVVALGAHF
jgi:hypothetical protein